MFFNEYDLILSSSWKIRDQNIDFRFSRLKYLPYLIIIAIILRSFRVSRMYNIEVILTVQKHLKNFESSEMIEQHSLRNGS